MKFLDSDIISYYLNSNKKVLNGILKMIDNEMQICTTIINVYEILKGFRWKNNLTKEKLFNELKESLKIFKIDDKVIHIAANIYSNLRKTGKTINDSDILIAAIVISYNGTLVTNNIKHYENIPDLRIENWL